MSKKITCVHLFNDFSGSPRVLSTVVKNLVAAGQQVEVMTSEGGQGFLSKLAGATYRPIRYQFFQNKRKRLFMLIRSQISMFRAVLKTDRGSIIYVNTLLPFGAALAGKFSGRKVVYHLHETTVNPPILKKFLKAVARFCASEAIYVSGFLCEEEALKGVPFHVVHNCLSADFSKKAKRFLGKRNEKFGPFTALMLCSLKAYKGVDVFVELARALPKYRFLLVLNASFEEVKAQFEMDEMPENLVVFPSQKDVHNFYEEAHVVLNLSHPEQWVETFGMTLLEGMSYGLPVISPPVGGPAKIVINGHNGHQIDQRNFAELKARLREMAENTSLYHGLSQNALAFSAKFQECAFREKILAILGVGAASAAGNRQASNPHRAAAGVHP